MKIKHLFTNNATCLVVLSMLVLAGMISCSQKNAPEPDLAEPAEAEVSASATNIDIWPTIQSSVPLDSKIEERVSAILAKMTLEEKVGQILQANIGNVTIDEIREYNLGSVLNGGGHFPKGKKTASAAEWAALADEYFEASTDKSDGGLGIPLIWGSDAVHGHNNIVGATIFPHNIGLGAANDPELVRKIGEATAMEIRASGLDWTFAPTVAVVRDDRWGRTYESYSETPEIVAAYAKQVVEGIQGVYGTPSFMDESHLLANAKHFVGDGGTFEGKDQGDNRDSEQQLFDIHAQGYVTALEAGIQIVMVSFSSWHGDKLSDHKYLLTDVLKDKMGFDGIVISDWSAHASVPGCTIDSCAAVINAGMDMIMAPVSWKPFYENTLAQVKSGEIAMSRLDDAVTRVLRVKARSGLLDQVTPSARKFAGDQSILGSPEHRAIAREAVRKSLVLLKNNEALLPLSPAQKVLVLGDGADNIGKQSGGWTLSWQGTGNTNEDFPNGESIFAGIEAAVNAAGGSVELGSTSLDLKNKPDVAILVYGEDPYAEFQGDRKNLLYMDESETNLALLEKLNAEGIPVVSVFLSGRPLWVNPYINRSDAFVAAWLPGSEGAGVSDVLFAKADGSVNYPMHGKLSFSWPKTALQFELNSDVTEGYDPLFAQGFGLSYGSSSENLAQLSEDSGIDMSNLSIDGVYFKDGRAVNPWLLSISDQSGEPVAVDAGDFSSVNGAVDAILVDREKQGDSRQFVWSGSEVASVSFTSDTAVDISRQANGGLGFGLQLRLDAKPKGSVSMGMGCGEACQGEIPLNQYIDDLTVGEWVDINWPLSCFVDEGLDVTNVNNILTISTGSELALTISDVRLVTAQVEFEVCPSD